MALTLQIRRGLQSALAAATMANGELAFTTDTNLVYASDGTNKHLVGRVLQGTLASRPTFGVSGRMFYATDTGDTYLDDGSAWQMVGISDLADMSGDLDDIADGTTYGKVANTELDASGRVTQVSDGTNVVTAAQARSHIDDTSNPHSTTASQVGIDDTDDITEGISNLYYTEGRVSANTDVTANTSHRGSTANPHSTSIANIGSGTIADLNTALLDGATLGAGLNDAGTGTTDLWSANKIENRVQQAEAGTDFKQEVKAATTANITLSNEQTIDGVALVAGDRVLVKNQTDATENGIYTVVDLGAWTRTSDADTGEELTGAVTTAIAGTTNSGTAFLQNAINPIIGTDNVTWVIFNGAGAINAGAGLEKDGNTLSVLMGAGLAELPTGQVGIEVAADGGLTAGILAGDTLSIVTDTTSANVVGVSTTSNGAGVKVDGTTIVDAGSETIGIANDGVTAAKLNADTAGAGLVQNGTTGALDVNADGTTIEVATDTLQVVANGIGATQLDETDNYSFSGTVTAATQTAGDNSTKVATTAYADAAASAVAVTEGNGIDITTGTVSADVDVAGAITNDFGTAGTLGVNVDGTSIEIDTNALGIKAAGVTATELAASVAGNGITGGAGTALAVVADSTGGTNLASVVNVSSNGVAIKIDDSSIIENASGQLEIGSIDGGSL